LLVGVAQTELDVVETALGVVEVGLTVDEAATEAALWHVPEEHEKGSEQSLSVQQGNPWQWPVPRV